MSSKKQHPLDSFFNPKNIAVIGASAKEEKIGHVIFSNFVRSFRGKIYPINPGAQEIYGIKAFPSVRDVKEEIELAVIAVPAAIAPKVLAECGQKKVKCATIISSGFAEAGNEKLEKELQKVIKKYPKTKVMGPNCLGVFDSSSGVDMLFLPNERLGRPREGKVSFISQSGALGSAILDWDAMKGYGINKFVSYGNATALDESDLLNYLADDSTTKVIVAYFEGINNGKKFYNALKNACSKKPVIVIKGGMSSEGAKAAYSHTASMAGDFEVFSAALKQANAIQASNMEEVFDFARVFTTEPGLKGKKVQIITDGGGYGVLAADAVKKEGLEMAQMSEERLEEIKKHCPSYAIIKNPVDLTGDADNQRYKTALEQAVADGNVDAVLTILLFQVPKLDENIVDDIGSIAAKKTKPILFISAGGTFSEKQRRKLEELGTTTFQSPFEAARALKALYAYSERKKRLEAEAAEQKKPGKPQTNPKKTQKNR